MEPLTFFINACMFTGLFFGSVAGWLMVLERADQKRRLQALCRIADVGRRIVFDENGIPVTFEDGYEAWEIQRIYRSADREMRGSR